ncbi:hypothetical protein MHU86_4675 [Fragilaria crotonensis]|nr:hypothetical protein MHU86_4675 [Fragilaria crotonensis]
MDDIKKGGNERNVAETATDATSVGRRSGPVNGSISATGSGSVQGVPNKLRDSISLNTNAGIQQPAAMSAVDSGLSCLIYPESRTDMKCSEGHAVCTVCIVDKLGDDKGCQLLCLFKECSSKIQEEVLYQRIPHETYHRYGENEATRLSWTNVLFASNIVRISSAAKVTHCAQLVSWTSLVMTTGATFCA